MNRKILITIGILVFALILIGWQFEKESKTPTTTSPRPMNLSQVKVVSLYGTITDGVILGGRSLNETIKIFRETKTNFVWQGPWRWFPAPESAEEIQPEYAQFLVEEAGVKPAQIPDIIKETGFSHENLKRTISAIKEEMPNIIISGGIAAQRINRIEMSDVTGRIFTADETWAMALDPQKWKIEVNGKPLTKEEFQKSFVQRTWETWEIGRGGEQYDWRKVQAYFPDITNPDFQELLLSWARKQIDDGVDAIWIDGLEGQALLLYRATLNPDHPAVRVSFAATAKIVDEIHKYGASKGKYVYIGSWAMPHGYWLFTPKSQAESWNNQSFEVLEKLQYKPPDLDWLTTGPMNDEILNKKIDKSRWDKEISMIKKIYDDIPIFAHIDWAYENSQTVLFSQNLTADEQRVALKTFDESFAKMGINFVYPIHGGFMGRYPRKLAFGKYRIYDSLAPEFETYDTIKELANKRSGN